MTTNIVTECGATNKKALSVFVKEIYEHLRSASVAWRSVAACLSQADEQYGFSSTDFGRLLKQVGFSKATASKLIEIDRNQNLKKHPELLNLTGAWTVLYEITTLNDAQFKDLVESLTSYRKEKNLIDSHSRVLTASYVKRFKERPNKKPNNYRTLVSVMVDVDALRTQKFSGAELNEVKGILRDLKNIPYLKLEATTIVADSDQRFLEAFNVEHTRALRTLLREKVKEYETTVSREWKNYRLARQNKMPKLVKKPTKWAGMLWEEVEGTWWETPTIRDETTNDPYWGPNQVCGQFGLEPITPQQVQQLVDEGLDRRYGAPMKRLKERPKYPTSETFFEDYTSKEDEERCSQESLEDMKRLTNRFGRRFDMEKFAEMNF